jgi:hypothetical protein
MIRLDDELVTLRQAARLLPKRRGGKRAHASTVWRWATAGLRGKRLEVLRVGGIAYTSEAALDRFFRELAGNDQAERKTRRKRAPGVGAHDNLDVAIALEGLL